METINTEQQRSSRARQLAGLKPFKPGQSGNPGGRQKGASLMSVLRAELEKNYNGVPKKELLAEMLVDKAIKGDTKAVDIIFNYTTPKPTQGLDITSGDKPIFIDLLEELRKRAES